MSDLHNPHANIIKKFVYDIIGAEKFTKRNELLARVCYFLVTQKDAEDFGGLIKDLYEAGYSQAAEIHKKHLRELGFNVQGSEPDVFAQPTPPEPPLKIFN